MLRKEENDYSSRDIGFYMDGTGRAYHGKFQAQEKPHDSKTEAPPAGEKQKLK
jgi:hypothetical protein